MCFRELRTALIALFAVSAAAGAPSAQPLPYPPRAVAPVRYGQSFFFGGYQFPAGGYNGGRYRPTAYSAADVYVTPVWGYAPVRDCVCVAR
jgi:hypothetical protein